MGSSGSGSGSGSSSGSGKGKKIEKLLDRHGVLTRLKKQRRSSLNTSTGTIITATRPGIDGGLLTGGCVGIMKTVTGLILTSGVLVAPLTSHLPGIGLMVTMSASLESVSVPSLVSMITLTVPPAQCS